MNRRNLLTVATAWGVVPPGVVKAEGMAAIPALAHPDAELAAIGRAAVPLIEEYNRCTAMFFALDIGDPALDEVGSMADAPSAALDVMVDRVIELPATTWDGYVAKARLLHHDMLMQFGRGGVFDPDMADARDLLAWSLVNDMLAGSAGV